MGFNQKMYGLGSKRSIIREIFEYSKARAKEIGADKVFDFSLGNLHEFFVNEEFVRVAFFLINLLLPLSELIS